MILWDDFKTQFSDVLISLEKRRKEHLKYFYLGAVFTALLTVFGLYHTSWLPICLLCGIFLLLAPVYWYRGTNRTAGITVSVDHRFSLKDEAYSKLFKLFGSFRFAPHGGISPVETRHSTIFPQHQLYMPEDYMVGQMNDVTVKLCEANIAKIENRQRVSVFHGLLIVCDISEAKVKLRGNFTGRTVLIYDPQKEVKEIAARYSSMQKLPLPGRFEADLEGYTTDLAEAKSVITPELLESIDAFAYKLRTLRRQAEHWDDKLAHAVAEIFDFGKDKLLSIGDSHLPSETTEAGADAKMDLTKADKISQDVTSLNRQFEIEFFEDKFVITIPCKFDLFETNSLFEPALNDEDGQILFNLMQLLNQITLHLNEVKK